MSAETPNPATDAQSKLILVVDDDEDFRSCLENAIRKEGFQVQTADDGSTAAIAIRERTPNLIITDLMMTGVGGFELMRSLATGEYADIPILVITARPINAESKAQMTSAANVVEIIQKPPSIPLVLEKLHRILQTRSKNAPVDPRKGIDELRNQLGSVVVDTLKLDLDVLIVDDSATARLHLRSQLEDWRCRCREAEDGKRAIEALKSYSPDVIVLDFTMPNLDGFGLLRILQGDPNCSEIPILVLTGKIMNEAMRAEIEMESNVERVFQKPPDIPGIMETLRQIALEKRKGMLDNP